MRLQTWREGMENNDSSGLSPDPSRWKFEFDWVVSYDQFIDSEGVVEIWVEALVENGRSTVSSSMITEILPFDYNDPKSSLNWVFQYANGRLATTEEQKALIELLEENSTLEDVVDMVIESSLSNDIATMTDLLAAQHIIFGTNLLWEEFAGVYEEWKEQFDQNANAALKDYIHTQISSTKYKYLYETLDINRSYIDRENFVQRHFLNKYGYNPTSVQKRHGSKKIEDLLVLDNLNFVGQEINVSSINLEDFNASINFIYQLVREPTERWGNQYLPFLINMKSKRQDYRDEVKTWLALDIFDDIVISQEARNNFLINSNGYEVILEELVSDRRFRQNFNLLWGNSTPVLNTENWKYEPWFGYFSDNNNIWLFSETIGWFWINKDVFMNHTNLESENERFIYRSTKSTSGRRSGTWSLLRFTREASGANAILIYDYNLNSY